MKYLSSCVYLYSDIEMVAVVDKKNKKKYKAIKVEEQEDVKSRKYNQSSITEVL